MNRGNLFLIGGMAALWPSLHTSPYYPLSFTYTTETSTTGSISAFHIIYSLVLILTLVAILIFRKRLQIALMGNRILLLVFGLLGAIGNLLVLSAGMFAAMSDIVTGVGLFFVAFYVAIYLVVWGARSSESQSGGVGYIGVVIALSYILYSTLWAIFLATGLNPSYLSPLYPLVSALFLYLCPPSAEQPSSFTMRSLKAMSWEIVLPCIIFVYFGVLCVRILTGMQMGELTNTLRLITTLGSLIVVAVMALCFYRVSYSAPTIVGVFAFLVVLYMAAFLVMLLFSDSLTSYDKRILIAIEHGFEVYLWMLLACTVYTKRISPLLVFSLFAIIIVAMPQFISVDLMYQTGVLDLVSQVVFVVPMAAVASFIVATAAIVLLVVYASRMAQGATTPNDDWPKVICSRAVEAAGLSPREFEVVVFMYRGYSAKKIGEVLYVSESTVKSHAASIYRKLSIHSKQDLIAFVDEHRQETGLL